jgi:dTDP-4-dehydrorhamnose reductase
VAHPGRPEPAPGALPSDPLHRLLVTGGGGLLGRTAVRAFAEAGWAVEATEIETLDIRDRSAVLGAVDALRPDVLLNAAAVTDADLCELEPDLAFAVNALGVGHLAEACNRTGALLCHVSSDYVFDGEQDRPYTEDDRALPLSVYGRSKLDGDRLAGPDALVVRTAWLSAPEGRNILRTVLEQARQPERALHYVDDQRGSPTVAGDLVAALIPMLEDRWTGLVHLTNQGDATWYELARHILEVGGLDPGRLHPIATAALEPARLAARPRYSVLDNAARRAAGVAPLAHWRDAMARMVTHVQGLETA